MARRTKEEAQETREHLLDAAEALFHAKGVSRTSLQEIAAAAGVTRGAVYWHFKDKADLFNAMMDRVHLPLEDHGDPLELGTCEHPMAQLLGSVVAVLRRCATDARIHRVYQIATQKVEYVDELDGVRQRHLEVRARYLFDIEASLRQAIKHSSLKLRVTVPVAARGLHAVVHGLLQDWILAPEEFDLVRVGRETVGCYLAGLVDPLVLRDDLRPEK